MLKLNPLADVQAVAQIGYEALALLLVIYQGIETPAWDDLPAAQQEDHVALVRYYLEHPSASEKDWHNYWRVRNRTAGPADASELREYEEVEPMHRLKIKLWRGIVHAFIG